MPKQLHGFDELERKFRALPGKVQKKALRNAATLAVNPLLQAAKAAAPVSTRGYLVKSYKGKLLAPGYASRSVRKKVKLYQGGRFAKAMIGVLPEAYYALQFVERGTSYQERKPWLEPAYRRTQGEVLSRFQQFMRKRVEESAKQ